MFKRRCRDRGGAKPLMWLALIPLFVPAVGQAQDFCSEPVPPRCVEVDDTYSSPPRIQRCQRDVREFEAKVSEYTDCIAKKSKRLQEDLRAIRERLEKAKAEAEEAEANAP